ncbi:STAS/SEC14 domain-containing protein [Falsihalocynthiibacter sp. SS001]|uniref:STAS/SEC14 domain-containing protein n=1 Tax=Falsihalocynthiibacter sp. SS001 TaxID=3349698 RepID=UPI0036D3CE7E
MIELIKGRPDGFLEFHASKTIEADDYEKVIAPALDAALEQHDNIRMLFQIGPDFEGYTASAALEDARLGFRHWRGFDRVAVVTDSDLIKTGIEMFSFSMPCPVKVFELDELDEARMWLELSFGSIHLDDIGGNAIEVKLIGKLDSKVYDRTSIEMDNLIGSRTKIRLLVDLREFDGWQGISALWDHLSLVRDHHNQLERAALVGDKSWQKLAEKAFSKLINADLEYFESDDYGKAKAWITE